jgi:hypothetical protein
MNNSEIELSVISITVLFLILMTGLVYSLLLLGKQRMKQQIERSQITTKLVNELQDNRGQILTNEKISKIIGIIHT